MSKIIIMADVIGSSKTKSQKVMSTLKKIVTETNLKWRSNIVSPLTITLGDEFQGIVKSLEMCVRILFDLEERIIDENGPFKLRYIIHLGKIETKINRKMAHGMLGPGLTSARSELTTLKKFNRRILIRLHRDKKNEEALNNAMLVYQHFVDGWKKKDFITVSNFLQHDDYKIVAKNTGIDISSAWRRNRSLSIKEYNSIKEVILYLSRHYAN